MYEAKNRERELRDLLQRGPNMQVDLPAREKPDYDTERRLRLKNLQHEMDEKRHEEREVREDIEELEEHLKNIDESNLQVILDKTERIKSQLGRIRDENAKLYNQLIDETYNLMKIDNALLKTEKDVKDYEARVLLLKAHLEQLLLMMPGDREIDERLRLLLAKLKKKQLHAEELKGMLR